MSMRSLTAGLLLALTLGACQPLSSQSPDTASESESPFFVPGETDAKLSQALAKDQDARLARCSQDRTCDQAHFVRALTALFENRQTAIRHFQEVLAINPKGHLATTSAAWLHVLQNHRDDDLPESGLAKPAREALLELLQREQDLLHREQAMRQELAMRDKKLDELTMQIELLKQIDQEMNQKSARTRPRPKPVPTPPAH